MPTLYEISVPVFIRGLTNLKHILKKAETYANEKNVPLSTFTDASLYPDMNKLAFQVQTAANTAKLACVRVAQIENVPVADDETTFAQFYERIDKTLEFLEGVDASAFEGKDTAEVTMRERKFTGQSYLLTFAIPNFFFHITVAYGILRKEGVPVGKIDFLAGA